MHSLCQEYDHFFSVFFFKSTTFSIIYYWKQNNTFYISMHTKTLNNFQTIDCFICFTSNVKPSSVSLWLSIYCGSVYPLVFTPFVHSIGIKMRQGKFYQKKKREKNTQSRFVAYRYEKRVWWLLLFYIRIARTNAHFNHMKNRSSTLQV